jgi:hypothetical protein
MGAGNIRILSSLCKLFVCSLNHGHWTDLIKTYTLECINVLVLSATCDKSRYHSSVTAETVELNK